MKVPFGKIVEQDNSRGTTCVFLCVAFSEFKEKVFMNGSFSCVISISMLRTWRHTIYCCIITSWFFDK